MQVNTKFHLTSVWFEIRTLAFSSKYLEMADILTDNTNKVLTSMSIPISVGMLSTFLFQIVDTYFVGQLGVEALTALSFSSTLFFVLVGIFMGLAVGVSIIIGQAVGAGDNGKTFKTIWVGIFLCLVLSTLLSAISIAFIDPIFSMLGATASVLPIIRIYTAPLLCGIPLLSTGLLMGGVLRSTGNVAKPEILMGIAGVINVILDYGLIFGNLGMPELGIKGAAFATVSSWIFIVIGMVHLLIKDRLLQLKSSASQSLKSLALEIQRLSLPTIVTQLIGPLTIMYLTWLLARQSELAVAAYGVAGRIETLLMIGILAVSTAIMPFIAQNNGAKNTNRIKQAIAFGGKSSTYLGILLCLLLYLFIQPIAGIFSDNSEVISHTSNYFYMVSLSYIFYGLYIMATAIFNGLKLTKQSLKLSLVKSLAFTIPMTLAGSFWGIEGIFIGVTLSNVLAGFYASRKIRSLEKKEFKGLPKEGILQDYLNDFKWLFGKRQ